MSLGGASQKSSQAVSGKAIAHFRHYHQKADGRDLWLYGIAPHAGEAAAEFTDLIPSGSVLRAHPLRGGYSIYSPHRQNRTFKPSTADDPLAPARPGGAITEIPFPDFEVAVFGNRFPSLSAMAPTPIAENWDEARASGACEVIVYTPELSGNMGTLSNARRLLLLEAIIHRYTDHFKAGAAYVLPFENRGDAVGATLAHPHGQIYAFPFVPEPQTFAARAFADGYDLTRERARWGEAFHVSQANGVAAFVPPYARFPYEMWIAPERCVVGPWEMTANELEGLATLLGETTRRYDALFGKPMPYMMSFQAAPAQCAKNFHFTVQYFPMQRDKDRLKFLASVEQSTGVFTVDVAPERAAEALRGAL